MPELEQLYLPNCPPKSEPLAIAHDLDKVPPPASALPNLGGRRFARSNICYPEKHVSVSLSVVRFGGTDFLETARVVDRGFQRIEQFTRVTRLCTSWDALLRVGLTPTYFLPYESGGEIRRKDYVVTPGLLDLFLRIHHSFYDKELSLDPFTDELAQ